MKKIVREIQKKIYYWVLAWKYRHVDDNLCCCGGSLDKHCNQFICRSAKDYAICSELNKKFPKE